MSAPEHLVTDVELAELEFHALALGDDISQGRVPRNARRRLTPSELAAQVNFAGIADDVTKQADAIGLALGSQRAKFLALVRADLGALGSVDEIVGRLQTFGILGINAVPGAADLIRSSGAELRGLIEALVATSADRLRSEAAAQGVDLAPVQGLSPATTSVVDRQANRLLINPHQDALRAITEPAIELPPGSAVDAALGIIDRAGRSLSENPLKAYGQQAGSSAVGMGRLEQADAGGRTPREIYASELLDSHTCDPCYHVDGKQYRTIAEMRLDYPIGIYRLCQGGLLCRGTAIVVWSTEVPARG